MSAPDFSLLAKRRFAPMFVVQFIGAFNDNALKFAMLALANYGLFRNHPDQAAQLATWSVGLFFLPYFLFSALAGEIADAWDKAKLMRLVKGAEIAFMGIGLAGLWFQSIPLLLGALFLMGCHSTLFGPVKYSILPQHLGPQEIVGGTGLIEAGTFLAILGGQLLPQFVPPWEAGLIATSLAVLGFAASLAIPPAPPSGLSPRVDPNPFRSTWSVLRTAHSGRDVWLCILGISWFFSVGAILLSNFGTIVADRLNAGATRVDAVPDHLLDRPRVGIVAGQPAAQGARVGQVRADLGVGHVGRDDRLVAVDPRLRAANSGNRCHTPRASRVVVLGPASVSVCGHGAIRAFEPGAWPILTELAACSRCRAACSSSRSTRSSRPTAPRPSGRA